MDFDEHLKEHHQRIKFFKRFTLSKIIVSKGILLEAVKFFCRNTGWQLVDEVRLNGCEGDNWKGYTLLTKLKLDATHTIGQNQMLSAHML